MWKTYLVVLLLGFSTEIFAQVHKTNVIQLNLRNNPYKNLVLRIQSHNKPNPDYDMHLAGLKNEMIWSFTYPDSTYYKNYSFTIEAPTNIDTISRMIGLKYISNNDTLSTVKLSFADNDTSWVKADYLNTDTFPQILAKDKNGNAFFKTVIIDYYLLKSYQDTELLSSIESTQNKFYGYNVEPAEYDTALYEFMTLIKKYPASHNLIEMLNARLGLFKSKADVQNLYNGFTEKNRHSYFGKNIKQYLNTNYFKNTVLKSWDTEEPELIIMDSTKYNLIIFSASWCVPCIKEIPLIKKIYTDLSDRLDITYVSIDEPKTTEAWRQLMRKENIPWRSVLASDNTEKIRKKYFVPSIPYTLFVHPGGFMEPIELRDTVKKSYLYRTVKQ